MQWLIDHIVCYFQWGIILAANVIIAGFGSLWGALVAVMPDLPGYPPIPDAVQEGLAWGYFIFDFGWLLAYLATFFTLMGAVFVLMIPLRWLRAVDS